MGMDCVHVRVSATRMSTSKLDRYGVGRDDGDSETVVMMQSAMAGSWVSLLMCDVMC